MPSLTVALLLLEWLHDGVYAGQCVCARQHREQQTYFPYLHNHEYFALDRVLLVSVGVCGRARDSHTNTYMNRPTQTNHYTEQMK